MGANNPTAKEVALADWRAFTCQPGTGTVSPRYRSPQKCQVVTGATMSSMNRDCSTRDHGQVMGRPWATARNRDLERPRNSCLPGFLRADDGIRTRDPHLGKKVIKPPGHKGVTAFYEPFVPVTATS